MIERAEIATELYAWARERSRRDPGYLEERFPRLPQWETGKAAPTLKQLEEYAEATYTPFGYFFLPKPPDERLPIPDFRTFVDERGRRPSADLFDTVYQCRRRQNWYREYALKNGLGKVGLTGSSNIESDPAQAAVGMRQALGLTAGERAVSWSDRLRQLVVKTEQSGVLVMINGVVGSNTHRKLDPEEFRGFALVDDFAPLVFVNGADTKTAQIFTLIHEIAHITARRPGLDRVDLGVQTDDRVERWCNEVSAEFLVPMHVLKDGFDRFKNLTDEIQRLARHFRVSTLVILRRLHDGGYLDREGFNEAYLAERARALEIMAEGEGSGGGNFYNTQPAWVSRTFMQAVINSTLEGETTYREAFRMLGISKHSTFENLAARLSIT